MFLSITSLSPRDPFLEVVGSRLLDRKPTVRERFRVVSDETQPVLLLTRRDSVWLREDAYKGLVGILGKKKGRKEHTNRPLPLRVVLFRNVVCALIFEIRCRNVSVRGRRTLPVGLTFTGNREENQATRFANVGCHEILHEIDI